MFRQTCKIGKDFRIVCVSVALLLSVVSGETAQDIGASLEIDSRLSSLEEQECRAWASYTKALLSRHDNSLGTELYNRYLREALELEPDSEHLFNQWLIGRNLGEHPERHAAELRPIWEKHPENVRLTMLYLDLLIQAGQKKEALAALLLSQDLNGWRSGVLTLRYVELAQTGERSSMVEETLGRALSVCKGSELARTHVAAACYWRDCHEMERAIVANEKTGRFKRLVSKMLSSRYRRKSLWHARKAAAKAEDLESISAYALSGVFSSQGCADEQVAYLQKLKDVNDKNLSDMIWYFVDMNHGLRELEREKELREFLSQVVFGRDWHRDVLECAADSYLALHDHERACEMFEMLSQKEPRNIRARLMIAHLSLVQGKSRQGLAALAPLRGLPPAGCELKARLLSQQGEHDKAYQEYKSLLEIHEKGSMGEKWKPNASFYDGITMTCLSLGRRDEALKYVKALYELDTEDAHGCNFYGYLLADFNQELDLAERLIEKALAQEPDNAAYLDSLAWVRFRQGRYQEALNGMISVLENGGLAQDPDGELREHLAAILKTLGYEETADFFQRQVDGMKK